MPSPTTAELQQSIAMGKLNPKPPAATPPPKAAVKPVVTPDGVSAVITHTGRNRDGGMHEAPVRRRVHRVGHDAVVIVLGPGESLLIRGAEVDAFAEFAQGGVLSIVKLAVHRGEIVEVK